MLVPRHYQQELFERACTENTLAVLDTGTGKTLVAVMLLRHVLAEERARREQGRPRRLAFFLVNLVPLVFRQARVLRTNCDASVQHYCGQMGVDLWQESVWRSQFAQHDVLVMTCQILLNV